MKRRKKKGLVFLFVLVISLYTLTRVEAKNALIIIMAIIILILISDSLYNRRKYYKLHKFNRCK